MNPLLPYVVLAIAVSQTPSVSGEQDLQIGAMCPVMTDEPIEESIFTDYQGQKVYFCCPRCRKMFLEDPEPYLENLPLFASVKGVVEHAEHPEEVSKPEPEEHGHGADASHDRESLAAHSVGAAGAVAPEHDHLEDHGESAPHSEAFTVRRAIRFSGKFHPLLLHFPIALVMAAVLAEFLTFFSRKSIWIEARRFSIHLAALSAAIVIPLGWAAGAFVNYPGALGQALTLHRWMGTGAGILILAASILCEASSRSQSPALRKAFRIVLFGAAALVGIASHFGATLIYGVGYFKW